MKHWTKLRRDIVKSERMAALLERNPLAYALFVNAKAVCDDYGRLDANPRKFKGEVAPMAEVPLAQVETALADMEDTGVITRYEVNGDKYMEIVGYNEVEDTDWKHVGKPEYPAPPGWTPPQSLLDFIAKNAPTDARIKPERYGLEPSGDGRPMVARRSPDGRFAQESDVDVDVERQKDIAPSGADFSPKAEKAQRDADRIRKQTEELDATLAGLSATDRALLDSMIAGQQQGDERKGRPLTLLQQKTQAEIYAKELAEHGPDCWRDCCRIACEKGVYTAEYARGCTKNWKPSATGAKKLWRMTEEGVIETEDQMDAYQVASIKRAIAQGTWDAEIGIDRTSPRHPDFGKGKRGVAA